MIGLTDYVVIGFYLSFLTALGAVFRRMVRNTSDYYRGGGSMLWWLTSASAMMSAVSAWSFTGAAGAIYESGTLIAVIYGANAASMIVVYGFTGVRFRRLRVVTYAEAIRRRYGPATEQFYIWLQMPIGLMFAGISLNAVGVFLAAIFHADVRITIGGVGTVVILIATFGGAWSVVAGDFLQLILTVLVMALAAFFTLRAPEVGGLAGLIARAPAAHFHWSRLLRPEIIALWCVATGFESLLKFNNLAEGAARFLVVKDGAHARKAALAMSVCFLVIPVLLLIPPMAASFLFPHLEQQFPQLAHPHEAAYVAVCLQVMPRGVIGLLIAGIFSVAMASMDTGLNRNSGLFVRSVYGRLLNPAATERQLLRAAKLSTVGFGILIMGLAGALAIFPLGNLFNLALGVGALFLVPLTVPMVLGLWVRRAPLWSGWSTAVVCFLVAWGVRAGPVSAWLRDRLAPGLLLAHEGPALDYALSILAVIAAGSLWFVLASGLRREREPEHVTEFFADLDRPITAADHPSGVSDERQYRLFGRVAAAYGAGITLFALLPNTDWPSRLSFAFCGGVLLTIGGGLLFRARWREHRKAV